MSQITLLAEVLATQKATETIVETLLAKGKQVSWCSIIKTQRTYLGYSNDKGVWHWFKCFNIANFEAHYTFCHSYSQNTGATYKDPKHRRAAYNAVKRLTGQSLY